MPVDPELLSLLRCPKTGQTLSAAAPETLRSLNRRHNLALKAALITEDQKLAYPVRAGFPVLIAEEAFELQPESEPAGIRSPNPNPAPA